MDLGTGREEFLGMAARPRTQHHWQSVLKNVLHDSVKTIEVRNGMARDDSKSVIPTQAVEQEILEL
jgi:hypothetical protein